MGHSHEDGTTSVHTVWAASPFPREYSGEAARARRDRPVDHRGGIADNARRLTLLRNDNDEPERLQPTPDAAVEALIETVTAQVRSLDDETRTALFRRLREDKENERLGAGFLFLPAAREALIAPGSAPAVRREGPFLEAWFTQPEETLDAKSPGYRARMAVCRSLTEVPNTYISGAASTFAGLPPAR